MELHMFFRNRGGEKLITTRYIHLQQMTEALNADLQIQFREFFLFRNPDIDYDQMSLLDSLAL